MASSSEAWGLSVYGREMVMWRGDEPPNGQPMTQIKADVTAGETASTRPNSGETSAEAEETVEMPARYAREIAARERVVERCPIDVYVAGINDRYAWPHRLVSAKEADRPGLAETCETLIVDSVINDPFYSADDVLDAASKLDADAVVAKDWPPFADPAGEGIHPADALEHFMSRYNATTEVTVVTMPKGDDGLLSFPDYLAKHNLSGEAPEELVGPDALDREAVGLHLLHAQQRMGLREYAERCARGDARNLIVTNNLIGERFGVNYFPWIDPCDDACEPIAAGVEDAAWDAGIPQMFFAGPWADPTRRIREWVRYVQRAKPEDHAKRVRAFMDYYMRSRGPVDSDAYVRDARTLSGPEMREKWAKPEGSFTVSPVLFMGQHLSGLYAHSHQRAVQVAFHGYRVWYVRRPADRGKADVKRTFASAFDHFTRVASFDLAADSRERVDAVCSQPPGSMVLLPESWTHSVLAWAEDDQGRPAPLDQAGGMTVSMSWQ